LDFPLSLLSVLSLFIFLFEDNSVDKSSNKKISTGERKSKTSVTPQSHLNTIIY